MGSANRLAESKIARSISQLLHTNLTLEKQGNSYRAILPEGLMCRGNSVEFFADTTAKTFRTDVMCSPILYYKATAIALKIEGSVGLLAWWCRLVGNIGMTIAG